MRSPIAYQRVVDLEKDESYSGSPPWIFRIKKPQANPTRTKIMHKNMPLTNILSALIVFSPKNLFKIY